MAGIVSTSTAFCFPASGTLERKDTLADSQVIIVYIYIFQLGIVCGPKHNFLAALNKQNLVNGSQYAIRLQTLTI